MISLAYDATAANGSDLRMRYGSAIAERALRPIDGSRLMSSALKSFAYIKDPIRMVSTLARLVEPCDWDRPADPIEGFPAARCGYLYAVLSMAFCYARQHGLLQYDDTFEHAVFNTGLAAVSGGGFVYACFELNRLLEAKQYRFAGFAAGADGVQRLTGLNDARALPSAPRFESIEPERKEVKIDGKHIARDRVYRFPERALEAVCGGAADDVIDAIEDLKGSTAAPYSDEREAAKQAVRSRARDTAGFMSTLRPQLSDAVHEAAERWWKEPALAVRSYNPNGDHLLTLLPLHLSDEELPDAALALRDDGSCYRAVTILELNRARAGALMVDRNLPGWLRAA